MKCLTICQPHAHLIVTPREELPAEYQPKRVENRRWGPPYRGDLLIHAGKSRAWMQDLSAEEWGMPTMVFGAILGQATLVACIDSAHERALQAALKRWPWLATHQHCDRGAVWWILEDVIRFREPVPLGGRQGLFDVDESLVNGKFFDEVRP